MNRETDRDEMREEYDIRGGVRGKYYERYTSSRLSVSAAPEGITVESFSSTASLGIHPEESTVRLIAHPVYQPLEPITQRVYQPLEPAAR